LTICKYDIFICFISGFWYFYCTFEIDNGWWIVFRGAVSPLYLNSIIVSIILHRIGIDIFSYLNSTNRLAHIGIDFGFDNCLLFLLFSRLLSLDIVYWFGAFGLEQIIQYQKPKPKAPNQTRTQVKPEAKISIFNIQYKVK